MPNASDFELPHFLPYLLNQAAEAASGEFQAYYRERYGMLRTEWRVLFHLGCYGRLSAKDICIRARIHKTKVSRAVRALEKKRYLVRQTDENDRRIEDLNLTPAGQAVFTDLSQAAEDYERKLSKIFSGKDLHRLRGDLLKLIEKG